MNPQKLNKLIEKQDIAGVKELAEILLQQEYFWLDNKKYLVDVKQNLVWNADPEQKNVKVGKVLKGKIGKENDWDYPTRNQISVFTKNKSNPLMIELGLFGHNRWSFYDRNGNSNYWSSTDFDDYNNYKNVDYVSAISTNPFIFNKDRIFDFLEFITDNNLSIRFLKPTEVDVSKLPRDTLKMIDQLRCRLPVIEDQDLDDPSRGLWEFHNARRDELEKWQVRGRDPALDVLPYNLSIDFGTSSTVVAFEDRNGSANLLRIGLNDFHQSVQPLHYENPTVLEMLDFPAMLKEWQTDAYQPLVKWEQVRCSHEARASLRNNETNPKVVSSILTKLKQWALRDGDLLRFTDQLTGTEQELAPLNPNNPVKGQKLEVSETDSFDPIELYAWFLGLNINWRNRGIFLNYYMTFPVAYPVSVKEKILASFRRGLMRSLPETLADNVEVMSKFKVEERASEPAAYVAAAVQALNIEPTNNGVPYAVFDFGGGTTDFDYGLYRWAKDDEAPYEEVFEHFEAAGDRFLGGENILENLAYLTFQANLDDCRTHKIPFTQPLDAKPFAGSELLLDKTQVALTNSLMMMSQLRTFWEEGVKLEGGMLNLSLLNRQGATVNVQFVVPYDKLENYLENRIHEGISQFFAAMYPALNGYIGNGKDSVQIFLAGNSSRSRLVLDAFGIAPENSDEEAMALFNQRFERTKQAVGNIWGALEFVVHKPLDNSAENPERPTAKTGVALGLLRLCPGSNVKVINHSHQKSDGEAPFAHYVGDIKRGKFNIGLARNAQFNQWQPIGMVSSEGIFVLYHTQSNLALSGLERGHRELYQQRLEFAPSAEPMPVFAKAVSPHKVIVAVAENLAEVETSGKMLEVNLG